MLLTCTFFLHNITFITNRSLKLWYIDFWISFQTIGVMNFFMKSFVNGLVIKQLCQQHMSGWVKLIRPFYIFFLHLKKKYFHTLFLILLRRNLGILNLIGRTKRSAKFSIWKIICLTSFRWVQFIVYFISSNYSIHAFRILNKVLIS